MPASPPDPAHQVTSTTTYFAVLGRYTHMPAIQRFGVCIDICVCEDKRGLF